MGYGALNAPRIVCFVTLILAATATADDLDKLREKLSHETDPAKRAKITVKIGRELIKQTRKLYKNENYDQAELKLTEYVMTVTEAYRGLRDSGREARDHPRGFKDLEIHLRKSNRALRSVVRTLPISRRGHVEEVSRDLREMRHELLQALMAVAPPREDDSG